jgi:hypothetical protein
MYEALGLLPSTNKKKKKGRKRNKKKKTKVLDKNFNP